MQLVEALVKVNTKRKPYGNSPTNGFPISNIFYAPVERKRETIFELYSQYQLSKDDYYNICNRLNPNDDYRIVAIISLDQSDRTIGYEYLPDSWD